MLAVGNIYKKIIMNYIAEYVPETLETSDEEIEEQVFLDENVDVRKIISFGQVSEKDFWYESERCEYVYILEGQGEIEYKSEDGSIKKVFLEQGNSCTIPAYLCHRVSYTSKKPPCVWLCIYYDE